MSDHFDPRIEAAFMHPTRTHALKVFAERAACPSEIAFELKRPTRHVAYHTKRLLFFDCIELEETKIKAGGRVLENYYRVRPWVTDQLGKRICGPGPAAAANPRLASALLHPTRAAALRIFTREVTSPQDIARKLDRSARHVSYHITRLLALECIELDRVEIVKGGRVLQHYYGARSWVPEELNRFLEGRDGCGA